MEERVGRELCLCAVDGMSSRLLFPPLPLPLLHLRRGGFLVCEVVKRY